MVFRSQPERRLIVWMLNPCRFSSSISCTSFPLNRSRHLSALRVGVGRNFCSGGGEVFRTALWRFYDRR